MIRLLSGTSGGDGAGNPKGFGSRFQASLAVMRWQMPPAVDCDGNQVIPTHVYFDPTPAAAKNAVTIQSVGDVAADGSVHRGESYDGVDQWHGHNPLIKKLYVPLHGNHGINHRIEGSVYCDAPWEGENCPGSNTIPSLQRLLFSWPVHLSFSIRKDDGRAEFSNKCRVYFNYFLDLEKKQCDYYRPVAHPADSSMMMWFSQSLPTLVD
ncbi:MAG: hypothetical protein Q4Q03_02680 [Bowdeniella nasicola]|nr:hypothetical protein [Bowdeniella nasicola]